MEARTILFVRRAIVAIKNDLYFSGKTLFMRFRKSEMMEIRTLTGLSQESTARMLDISRTVLAMHEAAGRSLPSHALLYEMWLVTEMKKPENQNLVTAPTLGEEATAKWKKELQQTARRCRYEAETLKRRMEDYEKKETQRLGRQLLVPCADKVVAMLAEQSKTTGYNPINEFHLDWLEIQRRYNKHDGFNETAKLEYMRNQFRYNMLLKEAEEAERMEGEM